MTRTMQQRWQPTVDLILAGGGLTCNNIPPGQLWPMRNSDVVWIQERLQEALENGDIASYLITEEVFPEGNQWHFKVMKGRVIS